MNFKAFIAPLLALIFSICFSINSTAQPTNDNCAQAMLMIPGTTCVLDTFDSNGATAEALSVAANPGCGFYRGGDVWFKVAMPSSGNIRFELHRIGIRPQFALYSGQCGNFTQLSCNVLDKYRTIADTGLAGDTIFLRVYAYNSAAGGTFSLCVWEPPVQANNDCDKAIFIPAGKQCVLDTFTNAYATAVDSIAPAPGCGFYRGGDVWFKTVMPASGAVRVEVRGIGSNPQFALYKGSCGSFQRLFCNQLDKDRTWKDTSIAGDSLFLRVFPYNSRQGGPFSLCIWEPVIAQNDDCSNALFVPTDTAVSMFTLCDTMTNRYATTEDDSIAPPPGCGFYKGGDVWFKTVIPSSGYMQVDVDGGNIQFAIYEGTCGSMVPVDCYTLDKSRTFRDTSLAGDTVYVRAFNYNTAEGTEFTIRFLDPPVPANDLCANAIPLVAGNQIYSNAFAAADSSGTAPNPSCGSYRGGDVWFTYLVPSNGFIKIGLRGFGAGAIPAAQLYSGTCGSMTNLVCDWGNNKTISYTDSSLIGQTLYVRVSNYSSRDGGTFGICAYDSTCKTMSRYFEDKFVCKCDKINLGPNQMLNTKNEYTEAYKTANGEDSILVFRLREAPEYDIVVQDTICYGSDYLFPDSLLMTNIDTFTAHTSMLFSQYGCDSIIHTELTVKMENKMMMFDSICSGSTYYFPDGDSLVNADTNVIDTSIFLAADLCDSLVVVDLKVLPTYALLEQQQMCLGSSFTFPDGLFYDADSSFAHVSILTSEKGCDSVVVTDLIVFKVDTNVTTTSNSLSAVNQSGDAYQWLDCQNDYAIIPGATSSDYTVTQPNGIYAVEITENNCVDTSLCHALFAVGIDEKSNSSIQVYPNPARDQLYVQLEEADSPVEVRMFSMDNKLTKQWTHTATNNFNLDISDVPKGVYLLEVVSGTERFGVRVVKN